MDRLNAGPDFICIGLPKSGTGWLYEQLRVHPDFWMPPVKEICYLDREWPNIEEAETLLARIRTPGASTPLRLGAIDARDVGFLETLSSHPGEKMNLELYGSLFRFKGDLLSGDVTPSYCMMDDETITRIFKTFPLLKVILLLRDPVSRAWSNFAMYARKKTFDTSKLQNTKKFRAFLRNGEHKVISLSRLTSITQRWAKQVPSGQFRYFFLDDIEANPDATLNEILKFLGGNPENRGSIAADFNRKSELSKLEMSDDIKEILVETLTDELRASRDMFGGHAIEWAKKYGVS